MKRPILIATTGCFMGILWELYFKKSLALFLGSIAANFIILICVCYKYVKNNYHIKRILKTFINNNNYKRIITFTIFFLGAILYIKVLDKNFEIKYNNLKEKEMYYICTVIADKKEGTYQNTYTVKVEYAFENNSKSKLNFRALIKVKKSVNLEYGDEIIVNGKLQKAEKRRNYKGFSYEEYLKAKKIYGIINTSSDSIKIIKKNNINILSMLSNKSKKIIIEKINLILPDETKEVALGFLLGYTDNMEEDIKEKFRTASLSHILAVSGAHISYIILGVTILLERIKLGKRQSKILTIFILVFFMFLTEFTPSVTRACIMGICILLADVIYKKGDFANSISLALLIILGFNPFAIYNIGLQLSFGGTIGIILFSKNISRWFDKLFSIVENKKKVTIYLYKFLSIIKEILAVTCSAQIIIIPITILNFNTISVTFFISNILAGFFMGVVIIGGFILVFIAIISINLAKVLGKIYNIPLELLILIVKFCSKIPGSKINVTTISGFAVLIYYLFILIISYFLNISQKKYKNSIDKLVFIIKEKLSENKKKIIKYVLSLIIIIVIVHLIVCNFKGLEIHMIDVGQGDCTLIITPKNKKIIVDGGGSENPESNYDIGAKVLLPYLLNRKISKIDYMIISHFDTDHVGRLVNNYGRIKSGYSNNFKTRKNKY